METNIFVECVNKSFYTISCNILFNLRINYYLLSHKFLLHINVVFNKDCVEYIFLQLIYALMTCVFSYILISSPEKNIT